MARTAAPLPPSVCICPEFMRKLVSIPAYPNRLSLGLPGQMLSFLLGLELYSRLISYAFHLCHQPDVSQSPPEHRYVLLKPFQGGHGCFYLLL